jgi:hypothetical protein
VVAVPTYYQQPALKELVWKWAVAAALLVAMDRSGRGRQAGDGGPLAPRRFPALLDVAVAMESTTWAAGDRRRGARVDPRMAASSSQFSEAAQQTPPHLPSG